jgi:hypothetical protein
MMPPVKKKFRAVMLGFGELYSARASSTRRSRVRIFKGPAAFLNLKTSRDKAVEEGDVLLEANADPVALKFLD